MIYLFFSKEEEKETEEIGTERRRGIEEIVIEIETRKENGEKKDQDTRGRQPFVY